MGDEGCVLNQKLTSLAVHVSVYDVATGNTYYNYRFSDNFYIPHWAHLDPAKNTGTYSPEPSLGANPDGTSVIGDHIKAGLEVKEIFKYIKADFRTECAPPDQLEQRYPSSSWPQEPIFTVQVNGKFLFQGSAGAPNVTTLVCSDQSPDTSYKVVSVNIPENSFTSNLTYQYVCPS